MSGERTARWGIGLGLLTAAVLSALLVAAQPWPRDLVMSAFHLIPFLAAFVALRLTDPGVRAMVWLSAGIFVFGQSFASMAGVTIVLLPSSWLLVMAGARAFREARRARVR